MSRNKKKKRRLSRVCTCGLITMRCPCDRCGSSPASTPLAYREQTSTCGRRQDEHQDNLQAINTLIVVPGVPG